MATEGLTSVAAPSLIDLSKKGEDPVTRAYYQLTHEIANNGAVMEQGETVRDQELFSIRLRLNLTNTEKKHILVSMVLGKKILKSCPVFHNYYCLTLNSHA